MENSSLVFFVIAERKKEKKWIGSSQYGQEESKSWGTAPVNGL